MGKTSLLHQYVKNQFSLQYKATIGADFLTKLIIQGENSIQLQLWDTAGTERYNSMSASFYRNSETCVLVFDLTVEDSFKNIDTWRNDFIQISNPPEGDKFPFVLIGNKNDMENDIKISKEQIDAYCKEHNNMMYYSTSAKDGNNLDEAFNKIAEIALERYNKNNEDIILPEAKYLKFDKKEEVKKKKCC